MGTRGRPKKEAACRTCKIRRVKCDETKPECRRCASTGRKCDGYTSLSGSALPFELFSSAQELRSFKYFSEKTSLEITSHYDETFWQSLVLQLSHANSGLGNLIIAIGSLHESLKDPERSQKTQIPNSSQMSFPLHQCNKAISILTQQGMKESNLGVLMTSCILFVAFELLQNRVDTALRQFKIGAQMLQTWRANPAHNMTLSERDLIENHLAPIFDRFGESYGLVATAGEGRNQRVSSPSSSQGREKSYSLPSVFLSLGQARASLHGALDYVFDKLSKATESETNAESFDFKSLSSLLHQWQTSFRDFIDNLKEDISDTNKRRIRLLEIQHAVGNISFTASVSKNEMIYDCYMEDFSRIVRLCKEVIEIETGALASGCSSAMSFSFDLGILMPLYFTATKCRDPSIRRQALCLLQSCPRREGIWLSWVTAMVAEQIISTEEDDDEPNSCADITIDHRVRLLYMHYDPCPVDGKDQMTLYQPIIRLSWARLNSNCVGSTALIENRSVQLPPTTDDRPGLLPYWVVMPKGLEISHWKLLLGKKVFEQPESNSDNAGIILGTDMSEVLPPDIE